MVVAGRAFPNPPLSASRTLAIARVFSFRALHTCKLHHCAERHHTPHHRSAHPLFPSSPHSSPATISNAPTPAEFFLNRTSRSLAKCSHPVRIHHPSIHSSTFPAPSHAARKPLAFRVRTLIRWPPLADDVPNNGLFGGRSGSSLAGTSEPSFSDPVDGSICSGPGRVPTWLVAASRDRCTLLPKLSTDP